MPLIKFVIKDLKMTKKCQNMATIPIFNPITREKRINTGEYLLVTKVEMFGTQKSAMPLSFSNFDFLSIYKADSADSRTHPFVKLC